jgi:uncharacterized repeat protein (TIGR01451 family)
MLTGNVRRRPIATVLVAVTVLATLLLTAAPAGAVPITSAGPLTRVETTPDLNCAVDHAGDASPEFFDDTACATLLASGGTLFGPANIPAGGATEPKTAFTPVSQTAVTGSGSATDPFTIVTVVDLGASGLRITQTDTYEIGQEAYRTDVTVQNRTDASTTAILYRAGDCFLQDSDAGFGASDPSTGSVSCVAAVDDGAGGFIPGSRIEQWFPLSPGSHFLEDAYSSVWAAIGSQAPFDDRCAACADRVDNGAGLSWSLSIPAGGAVTRSHLTVFSPLGRAPLSTEKTADSATAQAGAADGYTITIRNPNTVAVTLDAITDRLPAGFVYTPGSTTGATTADPSVVGRDLTWSGPIAVAASGSASIHFGVTVAAAPGDYFNEAGGSAEGFTVVSSGPTARITVAGSAGVPGAPTNVHAVPGDGSALVTWTPPDDDGGSPIDRFDVSCTATDDDGDVHSATAPGDATSVQVSGLTNGTEYRCEASAHNAAGSGPTSDPSDPVTPGGSSTSQEVDPAVGGTIDLPGTVGTSARMVLPAQDAPGPPVTATMSLFGTPGEVDATCGGNPCIGQGIEWGLSDPTAFKRIRIVFFEDPALVVGHDLGTAPVYKDGIAIGPCTKVNGRRVPPCVYARKLLKDGRWKITVIATGEDPKGRI